MGLGDPRGDALGVSPFRNKGVNGVRERGLGLSTFAENVHWPRQAETSADLRNP